MERERKRISIELKFKLAMGVIFLMAIVALGFYLRVISWNSFFIYPDSYKFLMTADFLREAGRFGGELGDGGMAYQASVGVLYKWGYPIVMAALGFLSGDLVMIGRMISLAAGTLGIVLVFFFVKKLFRNWATALAAALMTALSVSLLTWSTLVAADTLAFGIVLAGWILFFGGVKKQSFGRLAAAGVFIGLAAAVRPELILLVVPATIYLIAQRERRLWAVPVLAAAGVYAAVLAIFAFLGAGIGANGISGAIGGSFFGFADWGNGVYHLIYFEGLVFVFGIAGLVLMAIKKPKLFLFFGSYLAVLVVEYAVVRAADLHYFIHLLPVFVPAAAFFVCCGARCFIRMNCGLEKKSKCKLGFSLLVIVAAVAFLIWQIRVDFREYFPRESYEVISAQKVGELVRAVEAIGPEADRSAMSREDIEMGRDLLAGQVSPEQTLVVAFMVEPYWLATRLPATTFQEGVGFQYRYDDQAPYDFVRRAADFENVLLIVDEGARDQSHYPGLAAKVERLFGDYLIEQFDPEVAYYFEDYRYFPDEDVLIYLVPSGELVRLDE